MSRKPSLSTGRFALAILLLIGCTKTASNDRPAPPNLKIAPTLEKPSTVALNPRLHQPFKDAILLEPPEGQHRPPDITVAGKVVGKIYEEIAGRDGKPGLWDGIRFATPDGNTVQYTATLKTDAGDITFELWPNVAPNHVRNFIALAKAGYYTGLPFHRTELREGKEERFAYLESGCPLGTGEFGSGSIGYWLKPELSDKTHEEGTLGAWTAEGEDAACKFYITLSKTPGMDGRYTVFGKVIHGLDVAHRISKRPVIDEIEYRPREPIFIRDVLVSAVTGSKEP